MCMREGGSNIHGVHEIRIIDTTLQWNTCHLHLLYAYN
jgi:hypothetical protein